MYLKLKENVRGKMRITPFMNSYNNVKKATQAQTQFKNNNNSISAHRGCHKYTGNWSADLAYASLVDSNIANDLKSMDLIG